MNKIVLLILLFFPLVLLAQEEKIHEFSRLRWGIEVGTDMFNGKTTKNPNVRESQSYYYDSYYYDDLYYCGFMYDSYNYTRYYVGIKPEYSLDHRFAVSAGLRFSFSQSEFDSDRGYFLWKVTEENQTTNYVRVSGITQNNYYAGIPMEIKFFPSDTDYPVRQYFKTGMLFNFLLASHNSAAFIDDKMKKYNDKISGQMGKPSFQSGYLYLGIGLKFGRMNHPFGDVELQMPICVFKDKKLASFIEEPAVGFGLKTAIYIPTGKKKLSYSYE